MRRAEVGTNNVLGGLYASDNINRLLISYKGSSLELTTEDLYNIIIESDECQTHYVYVGNHKQDWPILTCHFFWLSRITVLEYSGRIFRHLVKLGRTRVKR